MSSAENPVTGPSHSPLAAAAEAELSFHPLADIFPLMEGQSFDLLVRDLREHGLREPIVLHQGRILDGRNRYRACQAAGVEGRYEAYDGADPVSLVVSLNLHRRHLGESQRAMVAAKLANMPRGYRTDLSPIGEKSSEETKPVSQDEAARLLNVGKRSVERATDVREHGIPELTRAVETGEVSVSAAVDLSKAEPELQRIIIARGEKEILTAAKAIREERSRKLRAERIKRLVAAAEGNCALPTDRTYPIIYADPPWRYEHPPMSQDRAVENHYPTMDLDAICALPVPALATADALLFIWVPPPILEQCFKVIGAWGFDYRTGMVWVKDRIGMGNYVRNKHEHLLIARRGTLPLPSTAARPPSVFEAHRSIHSQKPVTAYELIECMYPELSRIELFARNAREGWAAWGNQARPDSAASEGSDVAVATRTELVAARKAMAEAGA